MVAQEVHVEDVIPILAGIGPGGEDEIFRRGFMAPESVAAKSRRAGFWSVTVAL